MSNTEQGFWKSVFLGSPKDTGKNLPTQTFSDTPAPLVLPSRVDPDLTIPGALSLPTVYRSVQIISVVASSLEIGVYRDGERLPTPLIAKQPDPDRSRVDFIKRTVTNLATTGNAFWHVTRNNRGVAQYIRVLAPSRTSVRFLDNGSKVYDYAREDGKTVTYTSKDVEHLRLMELDGFALGLGPIQSCRVELTGAKALRDYARNWTGATNGVPKGILKSDQELDPETREAYADAWYSMLDAGDGIAVLGKGLSYQPLGYTAADIEYLDSLKNQQTTIAGLFGVPATFLEVDSGQSSYQYTNLTAINQTFYQNTLSLYTSVMEAAFSLILVKGQTARFETDNLLRADETTRTANYATAISSGWLTVDEVRADLGRAPLPSAPATPAVEPTPTDPDPEVISS